MGTGMLERSRRRKRRRSDTQPFEAKDRPRSLLHQTLKTEQNAKEHRAKTSPDHLHRRLHKRMMGLRATCQ